MLCYFTSFLKSAFQTEMLIGVMKFLALEIISLEEN